jgi:multiple sugar transport system permease protein
MSGFPRFAGAGRHIVLATSSAAILTPFAVMAALIIFSPPLQRATGLVIVDNFVRAVQVVPFFRFMLNGAFVALAVCGIQIAVAAPCAYALARLQFPCRRLLLTFTIIALAVPQQVIALPLFLALNLVGLANTYIALILPFIISPFAVFLLYQVFRAIPNALVDAARLDGMSEASIVWRIMVPLASPTIAALSILSIVSRWNSLFWPTVAVTSERLMPPVVGILYFRDNEAGDEYGALMAAASLIVAPLLLWFFLAQRRFIAGLTLGAVK